MRREFRRANPLEVKHYHELACRIIDYLSQKNRPQSQRDTELVALVRDVQVEFDRFGYLSTGFCLMVETDDQHVEHPDLSFEQKRAVAIDEIYLWGLLLGRAERA